MSMQRRCIRITGTRTGKLRARVEIAGRFGPESSLGYLGTERFEVTIGSTKWFTLDRELQDAILVRAGKYTNHLIQQLSASGYYRKHNELAREV